MFCFRHILYISFRFGYIKHKYKWGFKKMLKNVDVGLMVNHLSAHNAIIKRLDMYINHVQNQQIATIIQKQMMIMNNHVQVMKQLLDPKQSTVNLLPIPTNVGMVQNLNNNLDISDQDIAVDAHFTASAMAKENFNSAENMKNHQVKKTHTEMALQQSTIAGMYEQLMNQLGWMSQPDVSTSEQIAALAPFNVISNPNLNGQQQIINPNQIN